jgi:4-hydroxybenzoate polyprenyltransferase
MMTNSHDLKKKLRLLFEAVKFEHTVFALPFAYLGMILARKGEFTLPQFAWISLAMVGARTLAMAANRLVDERLDALNPRTQTRALPLRTLKRWEMILLAVGSLLLFMVSARALNDLCFRLFPVALIVLIVYPYTKRFTYFSHWIVGFADGMAPVGAWIGVTGSIELEGILLGLAVTFWVAGFDLIYACQDVEFDRREELYSVPAQFGISMALSLSASMHALTVLFLAIVGALENLGILYWVGCLLASGLLIHEHRLVKPDDLSRLDVAFFKMNGYIALVVFVATAASVYLNA